MNILVVIGGGREHYSFSLSKSPLTTKLIVAPGNLGLKHLLNATQ